MKCTAIAFTLLFLVVGLFASISEATRAKKKKSTSAGKKVSIPCPGTPNNIEDCLNTGCGPSLNPNLNKLATGNVVIIGTALIMYTCTSHRRPCVPQLRRLIQSVEPQAEFCG